MTRTLQLCVFIPVLTLMTACASFRGGDVGDPGAYPVAKYEKPSVSVTFKGLMFINGSETTLGVDQETTWKNILNQTYWKSNMFSKIFDTAGNDTDYQAVVVVSRMHVYNACMATATGLTLYLFPSTATDTLYVQTIIIDKYGNEVGKIEKEENVHLWQHLLLVFISPFFSEESAMESALQDIMNASLVEAAGKGYFYPFY